jgi:predicted nuclease with TOPRIM domain
MNKKQVNSFIYLSARIESLYNELTLLSRKNPNDAINEFKIELINSILEEANIITGDKPPVKGFSKFNNDKIPSNSDAVFILGIYRKALEKIRSDNIKLDFSGKWRWDIDGLGNGPTTNPPTVI